jgi:Transcriptional regulatory protein, C terminal
MHKHDVPGHAGIDYASRAPLATRSGAGDAVFVEGRPGSGLIGILGPVELIGEEPVPLGGVKERCLLAALAVHCGAAVSAASLVDALWGDDPPRTVTKTLQNYVLRVRRAHHATRPG